MIGGLFETGLNFATGGKFGQVKELAGNVLSKGDGLDTAMSVAEIRAAAKREEERKQATFEVSQDARLKDAARDEDDMELDFQIEGRQSLKESSTRTSIEHLNKIGD
jgi:hypothetical protein